MNLFKLNNQNKFYSLFEKAAENNFLTAKKLQLFCKDFKNPAQVSEKIHKLEHIGDEICHEIFEELNKSFITPIDREDIIAISCKLDDVIDLINASVSSIDAFYLKKPTKTVQKFADIIVELTLLIKKSLPNINRRKTFPMVKKTIIEINRLENDADILYKSALKEIFKKPKDAIEVIKWQSVYTTMEQITDRCEDIADILNGLLIKYA